MDENKSKEFNNLPMNVLPLPKRKETKNPTLEAQIDWLLANYDFRYNVITLEREFKPKETNDWSNFNDRAYHTLKIKLHRAGFKASEHVYNSLISSEDIADDYNPFKDYINNLPKWDGSVDYIEKYADQIVLDNENDRIYLNMFFKRWLVGMVMNMVNDEVTETRVNQLCFVLHGNQGIFKTTFLNNIAPKELRSKFTYTGEYNNHDKDHKLMLATKFIINLDEMATLNRNSIESVKSAITTRSVTLRKAYARAETTAKRRASFCGSINRQEFLTDLTGNRRFLIVTAKSIKLNFDFDVDMLFSQAVSLYKGEHTTDSKPFRYWFTEAENQDLEFYNDKYRSKSSIEQIMVRHFYPPDESDIISNKVEYMQSADILAYLTDKDRYNKMNFNDTYEKTIGMVLHKLGFKKTKKRVSGHPNPINVWMVCKTINPFGNHVFEGEQNEIFPI